MPQPAAALLRLDTSARQQQQHAGQRDGASAHAVSSIALPNELLGALTEVLQALVTLLSARLADQQDDAPTEAPPPTAPYAPYDGRGNNADNADWGAAGETFRRLLPQTPEAEAAQRPNPRAISNAVAKQTEPTANAKGLSDMFWQWGQFLDHDITLAPEQHDSGASVIPVPKGDVWFDPVGSGQSKIPMTPSQTVIGADGQAQQVNGITSYIDGSMIYGSDPVITARLRSFEGGRLQVTEGVDGDFLPKDAEGKFLAGDTRANEQLGLLSMHTLWVREHNQWADRIAVAHPEWSDEKVFQEARLIVIAEVQHITYTEFLPQLLGTNGLPAYTGYQPNVDATIANSFATAAFRFGHTMLNSNLLRLDAEGQTVPGGDLALRDAFFQPQRLAESGIDPILRGLSAQQAQALDPMIVDDVRNFLFGPPGAGGLDLASLNIERGREHELPSFNQAREALGLAPITSFDDPAWLPGFGAKLAEVYTSPDEVDLWVGGLAEAPQGDSLVGATFAAIHIAQFTALRDGNRYWYERQLQGPLLDMVQQTTLADVIERNTAIADAPDQVLVAVDPSWYGRNAA